MSGTCEAIFCEGVARHTRTSVRGNETGVERISIKLCHVHFLLTDLLQWASSSDAQDDQEMRGTMWAAMEMMQSKEAARQAMGLFGLPYGEELNEETE